MTDAWKTNAELITEAREHWPALFRAPGSRELIDRLTDALEAATRVPALGEPNGDREALHASPTIQAVREYLDQLEDWEAQNHVIEELRSLVDDISCCESATAMPHEEHARVTVPNAATENVQRMYDRACADIQEYGETIKALEAERDAALAAVERVRAIHRNAGQSQGYDSRFKGGYGMLGDCCAACGSHGEYGVEWPCPTVAALDGAPEPEWEYGIQDTSEGNVAFGVREETARLNQGMFQGVRRREAGPWLPVEGESRS